MKTQFNQLNASRFQFECQLDTADFESLQAEALRRYPNWGQLHDSLQQRDLIRHYVMERSLQRFLVQEPLDLRLPPRFKLIQHDSEFLHFAAELDIYPPVSLPAPDAIRIEVKATEPIGTDEIQAALDALQMTLAHFERVDRPARWGDQMVVNVYASYQGQIIPQSVQNERVVLLRQSEQASTSEAKWIEALIGMQAGQDKQISYLLPDGHPNPLWRGQAALSHVSVLAVASGKLSAPDDAFASALGFENLQALENDLAKQLKIRKEAQAQPRLKEQALAAYVEQALVEIPQDWIQQELEQDFMATDALRLQAQGVSSAEIETLRQTWLSLPYLASAKHTEIKSKLVLRAAIHAFDLSVDEAELEATLAELGTAIGKSATEMRAQLIQEQKLRGLTERILIEKVIERVFQSATITESPMLKDPD